MHDLDWLDDGFAPVIFFGAIFWPIVVMIFIIQILFEKLGLSKVSDWIVRKYKE